MYNKNRKLRKMKVKKMLKKFLNKIIILSIKKNTKKKIKKLSKKMNNHNHNLNQITIEGWGRNVESKSIALMTYAKLLPDMP